MTTMITKKGQATDTIRCITRINKIKNITYSNFISRAIQEGTAEVKSQIKLNKEVFDNKWGSVDKQQKLKLGIVEEPS